SGTSALLAFALTLAFTLAFTLAGGLIRRDIGCGFTGRATEVVVRRGEHPGDVHRAALLARGRVRGRDRGPLDDQLLVLAERGEQTAGGVGAVDCHDVVETTAPLRRGERDAGE